jgi:putative MATE family efflux protein
MMISMLGQALYNVVDSYFVSHMPDTAVISDMGDKAVNALTLAFPVQMLIMALGVGTGVGINAGLARSLGMKKRDTASRTAGNALFISACYYIAILLFGIFGTRAFIHSQTADPVISEMAVTYLKIVTIWSFGTVFYMSLEKIVMAAGNTMITMIAQLAGAVTNIVLDPVMIFGLLGCPEMGVAGAAAATVIGQCVSLAILLFMHLRYNDSVDRSFRYLRPEAAVIRNIYSIGAPAILMQALTSFMTYGMNRILGSLSASMVTAYGIYYKLQNFIFMPAYGLNNASIPIISYNFGAQNKVRIRDTIKYAIIDVSVIMTAGILLLQIFPAQIVGIFSLTEESRALCITALHIVTWGFFFAGLNIILQGVCQALGNGMFSLFISLLRMLVIVLPLAAFLSAMPGGQTSVWFSIPAAEAAAGMAAILLTRKLYRKNVR